MKLKCRSSRLGKQILQAVVTQPMAKIPVADSGRTPFPRSLDGRAGAPLFEQPVVGDEMAEIFSVNRAVEDHCILDMVADRRRVRVGRRQHAFDFGLERLVFRPGRHTFQLTREKKGGSLSEVLPGREVPDRSRWS